MARRSSALRKQATGEKPVELRGEVRAADLDGRQFSLKLDDGSKIVATFTADQERAITEALREHATRRLRLTGRVEVARTGRIKRVASVESVAVEAADRPKSLPSPRPIWEAIVELGASIPEEEWAKVPRDAAKNLHHYLYGAPKQEEE